MKSLFSNKLFFKRDYDGVKKEKSASIDELGQRIKKITKPDEGDVIYDWLCHLSVRNPLFTVIFLKFNACLTAAYFNLASQTLNLWYYDIYI